MKQGEPYPATKNQVEEKGAVCETAANFIMSMVRTLSFPSLVSLANLTPIQRFMTNSPPISRDSLNDNHSGKTPSDILVSWPAVARTKKNKNIFVPGHGFIPSEQLLFRVCDQKETRGPCLCYRS